MKGEHNLKKNDYDYVNLKKLEEMKYEKHVFQIWKSHDNIPLIMGGRRKYSKDPMFSSWDMSETEIQMWGFLLTPFRRSTRIKNLFSENWWERPQI